MRRTKKYGITLMINGQRSNVEIDNLTAALIPDGVKRAPYARLAVEHLWRHLRSEPLPEDPIKVLSEKYDCGYASIVTVAIAFVANQK